MDAKLEVVFKELLNQFKGKSRLWEPQWLSKPKNNLPFDEPGGVIQVTLQTREKPRFYVRSTEIIKNKSIKAEFFKGPYLGTGE